MRVNGAAGTVVHLDEDDQTKQSDVLRNVRNLLEALDDGSPIELVVHGGGISAALAASPLVEHLQKLINRGVLVAVCNNTMQAKEVSADELIVGAHVVPSGVAELVLRQREGWAYLRP